MWPSPAPGHHSAAAPAQLQNGQITHVWREASPPHRGHLTSANILTNKGLLSYCAGSFVSVSEMASCAVLPNKASWSRFLPLRPGSPCSVPLLGGRAASPGTRGLSTYLGFLAGPATGMSRVYLILSRCTTSFTFTVSILRDTEKATELFLTYTAATVKSSEPLNFPLVRNKYSPWASRNAEPAGKQTNLLAVTNLKGFPTTRSEWRVPCSNSDSFQQAPLVQSFYLPA